MYRGHKSLGPDVHCPHRKPQTIVRCPQRLEIALGLTLYLLQFFSEVFIQRFSESVDWHWSFWICRRGRKRTRGHQVFPSLKTASSQPTVTLNHLQRTQSRCCSPRRNTRRTKSQAPSDSQRRTTTLCTHLCLRRWNPPLESRLSWNQQQQRLFNVSSNQLNTENNRSRQKRSNKDFVRNSIYLLGAVCVAVPSICYLPMGDKTCGQAVPLIKRHPGA